jgi:hypothetical protein
VKPLACLALAGALSAGCGYHVAGRADMLPRDVRTIAVPAFANATTRYRLTQSLPAAITREFLARTRYRVVAGDEEADAVLLGSVTNYMSYPITFDPATGRAAGVQHSVALAVRLVEKKTGKELYGNPNLVAQSRYEVSTDTEAYFDESETSLERLSRDVARTVVSAILESF